MARTRMWTGVASGTWSEPRNWSPAGPPLPGDSLLFPSQSLHREMQNDLQSVTLAGITVMPMARPFPTLSGNPVTLTGDVGGNGLMIFNVRLNIAAPLTLSSALPLGGIDGPADGSGRLNLDGYASWGIQGSGNFSGTISGYVSLDDASLPDASITNVRSFGGRGTVGEVTIDAGLVEPSGRLHTRSLVMNGNLEVDLWYPSADLYADRLQVTGTVTLGGLLTAETILPLGAYLPYGQQYTIIDNDGTDPIRGTFAGLYEGRVIAVGIQAMQITYQGGDGNDVVLTNVGFAGRLWTGNCSTSWRNPCNWEPQAAPTPGVEPLVFGWGGSQSENDFPSGTPFLQLVFDGGSFGGNLLTIGRSIAVFSWGIIRGPLKLGPPLRISGTSTLEMWGEVDFNGQTMTVDTPTRIYKPSGSGTLIANQHVQLYSGSFSGTATGDITLSSFLLNFPAVLPGANITGKSRLQGLGTVGEVFIDEGGGIDPGYPDWLRLYLGPEDWTPVGTIRSKSLSLAGRYDVDLIGTAADAVKVTGAVALSGDLAVHALGTIELVGRTVTIIDNDGSDAVSGTFRDLPEGSSFQAEGAKLRITYRGGDGNDVALTVLSAEELRLMLSQSAPITRPGEPFTLTATLSSVPRFTGFGRFGNQTVEFINGTATIPFSLDVSAEVLSVVWSSGGRGFSVPSPRIAHEVRPADTSTVVGIFPTATLGQVDVVVAVRPEPPATALPAGTVRVFTEAGLLSKQTVVDGFAVVSTTQLPAGTHSITAVYDGEAMFHPSTGAADITILSSPPRKRPSRR